MHVHADESKRTKSVPIYHQKRATIEGYDQPNIDGSVVSWYGFFMSELFDQDALDHPEYPWAVLADSSVSPDPVSELRSGLETAAMKPLVIGALGLSMLGGFATTGFVTAEHAAAHADMAVERARIHHDDSQLYSLNNNMSRLQFRANACTYEIVAYSSVNSGSCDLARSEIAADEQAIGQLHEDVLLFGSKYALDEDIVHKSEALPVATVMAETFMASALIGAGLRTLRKRHAARRHRHA